MIKKILVIGHDNSGTKKIFSALVDAYPDINFLLAVTEGLFYRKTALKSIIKLLKEASFMFCFQRLIDLILYRIKGDTLYSFVKKRRIKFYSTRNINDNSSHALIKNFEPDIIVSTFTMHIIKEPTIRLAKVASIGCHPSILPNYRGLEVFFWALANKEKTSGVSIFYLSDKVDTGKVILQEKFDIIENDTVESIYSKLTKITAGLLVVAVNKFNQDEKFKLIDSSGTGSYYPMPTREAYKKFKITGRKWR